MNIADDFSATRTISLTLAAHRAVLLCSVVRPRNPHTSAGCTIKTVVRRCSMDIFRLGILERRKNFALGLKTQQNLCSWMVMSAWAR
jgi:hypothetical protein